jgi:dTMP kinase
MMDNGQPAAGAGLIAVEGIDGCGKSSLARMLADGLSAEGRDVLLLDRGSVTGAVTGYPADHLARLRALIWDYPRDAVTSQLGFRHWSHLVAAWFHAVDHLVVRPVTAAGTLVIADSWYHKFAARFTLTAGAAAAQLPFAGLSQPRMVLWLDVPPAECAARRPRPRATERGEWQGLAAASDGFVAYQSRVRAAYASLAAEHGWERIGPGSTAEVTARARALLATLGDGGGHEPLPREASIGSRR